MECEKQKIWLSFCLDCSYAGWIQMRELSISKGSMIKSGRWKVQIRNFSTPVMQKPDHNYSHAVSCAGNTSSSPEVLQWESWRWTGMLIRREHLVEMSFCPSNIAAKKQLQPAVTGLRPQVCSCRYFGVMKDVSCRQLLMGLKPDAGFLRGDDRDRDGLNLC